MNKPDWKDAPEGADRLMKSVEGEYFWCDVEKYLLAGGKFFARKFGEQNSYTIGEFELVEMRSDPWKEGEERMKAIGPNGNEGEHYSESDNVNHPEHYQSDSGIECIDAIRAALGHDGFIAYCRGNTIKYNWRSDSKGKHAEDLKKGAWYSNKAASEMEKSK
jgi:hypothetical protein